MMIVTNPNFINEYKEYDELMELLESFEGDLENEKRRNKYNDMRFEMQTYFENSFDYIMEFGNKSKNKDRSTKNSKIMGNGTNKKKNDSNVEGEKDGILSSIGKKILQIIAAIGNFLKKIGDIITGRTKKIETDVQTVNKILNEHPDLKNVVVEGIDKSWFTYADVAKYKDNIVELVSMLKQNKISHRTFSEKVLASTEKFRNTVGSITKTVGTVSALLLAIPSLLYAASVSKNVFSDFKQVLSDNKDVFDDESLSGVNTATQTMTKNSNTITKRLGKVGNWLTGFAGKHGDSINKASTKTSKLLNN